MQALFRIGLLLSFVTPATLHASTWQLTTEPGSWSETVKATYKDAQGNSIAAVCMNDSFEAQVTVPALRLAGMFDVTYRIDNGNTVTGKWSRLLNPYIRATPDVDFVRALLSGNTVSIELKNAVNPLVRLQVPLQSARDPLIAALKACRYEPEGLETRVPGLRREIARDLEMWGPKYTHAAKRVLAAAGAYDGPLDTPVDADFALKAQAFHDTYLENCSAGRVKGDYHCSSRRKATTEGKSFFDPGIGSIIYDSASGDLKEAMGALAPIR